MSVCKKINKYSICLVFIVFFIPLSIMSCKEKDKTEPVYYNSPLNESLSISVDTLFVETGNNSGQGFFRVIQDKLYFFDTKFFLVTNFDTLGNIDSTWLGMGEGKTEIEQFITCTVLPESNDRLFFAHDYNFRRYDSSWHLKEPAYLLTRLRKKGGYNTTDLSTIGMYDFNWEGSSLSTLWLPSNSIGELFIPLNITRKANKKVNKFTDQKEFYENARTFGKVDTKNGKIIAIGGRYPTIYSNTEYLTMFSNQYLEVKNDSIFVSYEADKEIHVYSPDMKLQYIFGREGKISMNTNYPLSGKHEDFYNTQFADSCEVNFGYYTHLYFDSKNDLLFRSYTTGSKDLSGLQVYQNITCAGDFAVPRKFNVIGRIGDYYYADGFVTNNKVGLYRLKITKK